MDSPPPLFEQLLRQVGKTRRLARILLGDESAAEDAIQETWLSASRRPLPEAPEPWLRTALRNRLLNQARDDRRRAAREEKSLPGDAPDSPEELLARLERHRTRGEAKSVMKAMQKKGKWTGLKFECDECHKDEAAGSWTLRDGAEKKFKELLARQ